MLETIDAVLDHKENQRILTIEPTEPVFSAIRLMADEQVGALLVVDQLRLVGVISERDYARKVVLLGRSSKETRVEEIMTRRVIFVRPETTVSEALAVMNQRAIRHLPVMHDDAIRGIVSMGDLVRWLLSEQTFRIAELEHYILGTYPD